MQSIMNLKIKYRESFRPFAPSVLRERVAEYFELEVDSPQITALAMGLRALSRAKAHATRRESLQAVLALPTANNVELLAAIAGRCWEDLQDPDIARPFLEALARCEAGSDAFAAVLADLLFIPGMREPMLASLRSPERSPQLAAALEGFFGRS